jgi:hypothetical protein
MADTKISALPASTTPLAGTEVLPIVQSGVTRQVSVANLTAGRAISATSVTASTGNFVVGTSGQGIDFSATPGTGTSELLADYEEGTWTPTLTTNGFSGGVTLSSATGTYTKIGRQVTVQCNLSLSGFAYQLSTNVINGLPFTPAARNAGSYMTAHDNRGGSCIARNAATDIFSYPNLDLQTSTLWTFTVTYSV